MSEGTKKPISGKVKWGGGAGVAAAVALILSNVYKDEGGYVNHKNDRGGATNFGVTQAVAVKAGWKDSMRAFPKQCDTEDDVCADKIYYQNYMEQPGYVPIIKASPAVAEEVVNTAVNMGPGIASRFLQRSINDICVSKGYTVKIADDGKVGKGTISAFTTCQAKMGAVSFCKSMLKALDGHQLARYDGIVRRNPSQRVFYKGWVTYRIGNVDPKKCEV